MEKVDDNPSHGDVPGTSAYQKRGQDSVPDEVEVIPEGSRSRSHSLVEQQAGTGETVPRTVVERVEPERPSHGDVPGTVAYDQRRADAVPDVVTTASPDPGPEESPEDEPTTAETVPETTPEIPETIVSEVETSEQPGPPHAHRRSPSDAVPDVIETVPDAPGKSGVSGSMQVSSN